MPAAGKPTAGKPAAGRLRTIGLFAGLPDADLELLTDNSHPKHIEAGEVLFAQGDEGDAAYAIEKGEVDILTRAGNAEELLATRGPGEVIGEMALLRDAPRIATARARTEVDLLVVPQEAMTHLLETSPTASRALFDIILERLDETEAHLKQRERMAQLGTLTAGVAHELNNPAAAVARAAQELSSAVYDYARMAADGAALLEKEGRLRKGMLDEAGQEAIFGRRMESPHARDQLSALERSDLEQQIEEVLAELGMEEPWTISGDLADVGVQPDDVRKLHQRVGDTALPAALGAFGAARRVDSLLHTVTMGSERLSTIVKALKSYSFLDQAPLQEIDLTAGIDDTLLILGSMLAGIHVEREYAPDLVPIVAHGSELNQVWTNLIANAADAVEERRQSEGEDAAGRITISARNSGSGVVVEVTDDGFGIPPEIRDRIFDSFFTTKAPGKGTGMGLDISHQIVVLGHHGSLSVDSQPGRTTFRVALPANPSGEG